MGSLFFYGELSGNMANNVEQSQANRNKEPESAN